MEHQEGIKRKRMKAKKGNLTRDLPARDGSYILDDGTDVR